MQIEFEALAKCYGDFDAVKPLTLSVRSGEVFGFLGPNGAGKTTTIRMMMGILVPSAGRVTIGGLDCHSQRALVQQRTGYLLDNPVFYDYLRGREILQFVAEMHGLPRREAAARAEQALHDWGCSRNSRSRRATPAPCRWVPRCSRWACWRRRSSRSSSSAA